MYNGVGLATARGSATSGYVQRNLAHVSAKVAQSRLDPVERERLKQLEQVKFEQRRALSQRTNTELASHEQKRKIELKLLLLEEKLREDSKKSGITLTDEDIDKKISDARDALLRQLESASTAAPATKNAPMRGDNPELMKAFGIRSDYQHGDSLKLIKSSHKNKPRDNPSSVMQRLTTNIDRSAFDRLPVAQPPIPVDTKPTVEPQPITKHETDSDEEPGVVHIKDENEQPSAIAADNTLSSTKRKVDRSRSGSRSRSRSPSLSRSRSSSPSESISKYQSNPKKSRYRSRSHSSSLSSLSDSDSDSRSTSPRRSRSPSYSRSRSPPRRKNRDSRSRSYSR